jgi:serine/threonine-protein kinase
MSIIANRIIKEPVRRPTEFNPDIPSEIERIVLKSVAQQRSERYQTAQEMLAAIEKFRSEQKISEIVKTATAKEKARAKAEIEKEKEKANAVILEEKLKASLKLAEEKKEIKRKELLKLMKIAIKATVFVSIVYLMLFLIYETNLEEDRIKKEIARKISLENSQSIAEHPIQQQKTESGATAVNIPSSLIVTQPQANDGSEQHSVPAEDKQQNGLMQKDIDWIQTQFQLAKNYEFVKRQDLAIESYMKIIRKFPKTKYSERARKYIRILAENIKD